MKKSLVALAAMGLSATACASYDQNTNTYHRGAQGAVAGAVIGAIIGNNVGDGDAETGAAIGAVIGGTAGAYKGCQEDGKCEGDRRYDDRGRYYEDDRDDRYYRDDRRY